MKYLMATTYCIAEYYCKIKGLDRRHVRIITQPEHLAGIHGEEVIVINPMDIHSDMWDRAARSFNILLCERL